MKGTLFYSKPEGLLFLIAGYDNPNPKEMTKKLKIQTENFAKLASVDKKNICTMIITEPSEYQNMRVFHTSTKVIPEDTYVLNAKAWTMKIFLSIPFKEYSLG
jgi:hypothetical protein